MLKFNITILGANAALPILDTITSAQVVNVDERLYIVDCGEGMQTKLQQYRIRRNRIRVIMISHLHGDHVFGLPGLLTSFGHFQRKEVLTVIGPIGIRAFIDAVMLASYTHIDFELKVIELGHDGIEKVFEDDRITVFAFPLHHRVPTYGYKIMEQERFNIDVDFIRRYGLDYTQIIALKRGQDVFKDGVVWLRSADAIKRKQKMRSYAYCSDTAFDLGIVPYVKGVDILYHEATYLGDKKEEAWQRRHATADQAAAIAKAADVGLLVLGHFSTRYGDKALFLKEAGEVFEHLTIAKEGMVIDIEAKKK